MHNNEEKRPIRGIIRTYHPPWRNFHNISLRLISIKFTTPVRMNYKLAHTKTLELTLKYILER